MEVEIKLRLPNADAHKRVGAALAGAFRETHAQENYFFDGPGGELEKERAVLRVRFYNHDKRALLTLKGKQVIKDGVGRGSEEEEDLDPLAAREFLTHPAKLLAVDSPLVRQIPERFSVRDLVCLGGFCNTRSDYDYEGLKLELDETHFDWGTVWEIEVETPEPEALKPKLEAFLKGHGIPYTYHTSTKYANFRNRTLL